MTGGSGKESFFTSGIADEFRRTGSMILGRDLGPVHAIPLWEDIS